MTEEQAIEILKEIQEGSRAWLRVAKEESSEKIYLRNIEAIETVLNILKDKDREIEKKDKQIDLMTKHIAKEDKTEKFCNYKTVCDQNCEECVVQHFKDKVTEK